MARPRKQSTGESASISGGQASYVLERLLKDRRVSQTDINRYVAEMRNEISDLESRLMRLKDAAGHAVANVAAAGAAGVGAVVAAVRRRGRPPGSGTGKRRGRPPGRPSAASVAAGAAAGASAAPRGRRPGKRGRGTPITAEQLASRQLQGRYLALVRQFPEARRAQYARIAREKGREAAIADMQGALKK
ncbi:MAG TPA: hypothetical protein VEK57_08205 [Thermoanaerobaculia bacterium]|nr:hypothetical protein [Thermoanaerobaculia bacterium]